MLFVQRDAFGPSLPKEMQILMQTHIHQTGNLTRHFQDMTSRKMKGSRRPLQQPQDERFKGEVGIIRLVNILRKETGPNVFHDAWKGYLTLVSTGQRGGGRITRLAPQEKSTVQRTKDGKGIETVQKERSECCRSKLSIRAIKTTREYKMKCKLERLFSF
ncbi:hypothetical protein NPIL_166671 [Nephila pilipes]|uniref:Uncharacterized protein n=1 Tax=Nephila pilipes TaxID=299642 RepID=A0A8X6Q455_NEPPI|nr:hypothetical protein NPIL_166671 [Nephila pilipes]